MGRERRWRTDGVFRDRTEAGELLAEALGGRDAGRCVVAAVPRGGVAVALPLVERLGAPFTVIYARKLSSLRAPEVAFGAMDEDGEVLTNAAVVTGLGLTYDEATQAVARVRGEIERRMRRYRLPPLRTFLPGASVVLVDDGLATGLTMLAAIAYARRHGATEVTVAVPCASAQAAALIRREADRLVTLVEDDEFLAVGEYYADFAPVTDDEVVAMLERARLGRTEAGGHPPRRVFSFPNPRGLELAGELLVPEGPGSFPVVVFAHGWGSGKESPRNRVTAEALREAGLAALLFDFTGHGASEGTLEDSTPARQVEDLGAAIDAATRDPGVDGTRVAVVGSRSGAAVALLRAAVDPRIRALALRSANPSGAWGAAGRVAVPTLLVVGELDDEIVGANEGLRARLAGPARLEVVPGADHLFEDPAALRQAIAVVVAWLGEALAAGPRPSVRPHAA